MVWGSTAELLGYSFCLSFADICLNKNTDSSFLLKQFFCIWLVYLLLSKWLVFTDSIHTLSTYNHIFPCIKVKQNKRKNLLCLSRNYGHFLGSPSTRSNILSGGVLVDSPSLHSIYTLQVS